MARRRGGGNINGEPRAVSKQHLETAKTPDH
jgi:hypothetical protein